MVVSKFQFLAPAPAEPGKSLDNLTGKVIEMAAAQGCTVKEAVAGEIVLAQDAMVSPMFLLLHGIMGAVVRTGRKRMTLHAFVEGDAFADVESFIGAGPSIYGIEALTATKYLEIPRPILQHMGRESPEVFQWVQLHHLRMILQLSRRIVTLAATSPIERYRQFVRLHPALVNRLPQYEIASILGISAESLSRVRRRISQRSCA